MAIIKVDLSNDMSNFVEEQVAAGTYGSSSELVSAALHLMQSDMALEEKKLAILHDEVRIGLAAAEAGSFSDKNVRDILDEVLKTSSAA
jgi:antitoxin ParD1/3/4